MKGIPLAFNKDFQEDKERLFDAADTWQASIEIFANMIEQAAFREDVLNAQLNRGFLNATDVAEHLAQKGIPFREAHEIVGRMVRVCEEKLREGAEKESSGDQFGLEELTEEDLSKIDNRLSKKMLGDISIRACVEARKSFGGTAPDEVRRQIETGRKWLAEFMA